MTTSTFDAGPLVFEGGLVPATTEFEFRARSPAAMLLTATTDPRLVRALDATRAACSDGRAMLVADFDTHERTPPPGYATQAEVRGRFVEALQAEFPGRAIECHKLTEDR